MNTPTEKRELIIETRKLRERLISEGNPVVYSLDIPNVLLQLETLLSEAAPSQQSLTRFANGIFRIVTEDYDLARSEVGRELMHLSYRVADLAQAP